ncbi:MAG: M48 family metalloprotease [Pirellulales bacterium]|nr:M48 family metalloprotease [Pirellulales bacterium]
MPLSIALAILLALVAAEFPPEFAWGSLANRLLFVGTAAMAAPLVAMAAAAWTARGVSAPSVASGPLLDRFERWRGRAHALWLISVVALAFAAGWGEIVRQRFGLQDWVLADELLILLPVLGPLLLLWAATYRVEEALARRAARCGIPSPGHHSRLRYLVRNLRQQVLPVAVPVLLAAAASDLLGWLPPGPLTNAALVIAGGMFLALLVLGYPWLLRMVWPTAELSEGPLKERLLELCAASRVRIDRLLVWQSDRRIVNAAVAGIVPGCRFVFLSDGLLATLAPQQIEAVFLHELGHLRYRHLLSRACAVFAPVGLAAVGAAVAGLKAEWPANATGMTIVWIAVLGGLYVWFGIGRLARALEIQADAFACRALAAQRLAACPVSTTPAAGLDQAVEDYLATLERLVAHSGAANRATWQHDGLARRANRLRRVLASPQSEKHFERRLALVRWLLGAASIATLMALPW